MRMSRRKQVQQQNHQRWMAFVEKHGDAVADILCAQPTDDLAPMAGALRSFGKGLEVSATDFYRTDLVALFLYLFNAGYTQTLAAGVDKDALNLTLLQRLAPYHFNEGGVPVLHRTLQLAKKRRVPDFPNAERRTVLVEVTVVCTHAMLPAGREREWIAEQLQQIPGDLGL